MSVIDYLFARRAGESAAVAKERLQIVLAHERARRGAPEFLPRLQRELLEVVGRYVEIGDDALIVALDRHGETSVLEINVELDRPWSERRERSGPSGTAAG